MNATTTAKPCVLCDEPAEHATYAMNFLEGRPLIFVKPEQTLRGAAVCARCFLESEDR